MLVTGSIDDIHSAVKLWRRQKLSVGFVPTMGALHEGHLALIREARRRSDRVVISIFVNPAQFGPNDDFSRYPRKPDEDLIFCRKQRVAALFNPMKETVYQGEERLKIEIGELSETMCGASRPGFFEGIVKVINKFFNIVEPDIAVFGQKDFQQFMILKQMVREFNHQTEMVMVRVQREADGLAYSSRNTYLNSEERRVAPFLFKSLSSITDGLHHGDETIENLVAAQKKGLEEKGFKIDYLDIYSQSGLKPVNEVKTGGKYVVAGAVYLGVTRLIDNILIDI